MANAESILNPMVVTPAETDKPLFDRVHEWIVTVDHKKLGLMYIGYGILFLVIGGMEATIMRIQLAVPHNHFVSPQTFNRLFTMHGTTMVFLVGMPMLFGFANYLAPLMIGARDMAFPRLNAWSFWMSALGGIILYFSFIGGSGLYGAGSAPDVGWFAYAPLTSPAFSVGHSTDYWIIGLLVSGFGSIGTAAQYRDHDSVPALSRHDAGAHAVVRLAESGCFQHGADRHLAADGGADHAADRSLPGRPLLRHAGRRISGHLDALLLDLRTSGSLRTDHARLSPSRRRSFRSSRASRSLATPSWWRPRCASASSASACGRTTCSPSG